MKVLQVHERYQEPGGEDQVVAAELNLLTDHGHEVHQYLVSNEVVGEYSSIELGLATVWSREAYGTIRHLLQQFPADIMHVHNTLPLLSPSIYFAARSAGVPVVQTLHNYRLVCPAGTLFRGGRPCELCVGKTVTWPAVRHACYRNDRMANVAITAMLAFHRAKGTYRECVSEYIALTRSAREVYVRGGLPAERITVKPNFVKLDGELATAVKTPFEPTAPTANDRYALFVGRLAPEKGLSTLLEAWRILGGHLPLKIVGDGPLVPQIQSAEVQLPGVQWLGRRPRDEVMKLMRGAYILVFPSIWYEGFPVTLAEAFACGLPVIASNLGSMKDIVSDGKTGRLFPAGDAAALAEAVSWSFHHPGRVSAMHLEARREYEELYTPEANYVQLMRVYKRASASPN